MLLRFLCLLGIAAVLEIALLVVMIQRAGFFPTIAILLIAGFVGAALARWQGLRAWHAIRADLAERRAPTSNVIDGAIVLVAGLLLALPGLISDLLAILLLIPQVRAVVRVPLTAFLAALIGRRMRSMAAQVRGGGQGEIIDAEFRRADLPTLEDRSTSK